MPIDHGQGGQIECRHDPEDFVKDLDHLIHLLSGVILYIHPCGKGLIPCLGNHQELELFLARLDLLQGLVYLPHGLDIEDVVRGTVDGYGSNPVFYLREDILIPHRCLPTL